MRDELFGRESGRHAADRERAEAALHAAVPGLSAERLRRLILAQRPASAAATLQWLTRRAAAGYSLDELPEADEPPPRADLVDALSEATAFSPDQIQELVDYVWYHPQSLRRLSRTDRISLIRSSVRISFHNPRAVAQVALEGA